jgi:hypothetical protein
MAVNYIIQADVVDIAADTHRATDAFLVDGSIRNSVSAYQFR